MHHKTIKPLHTYKKRKKKKKMRVKFGKYELDLEVDERIPDDNIVIMSKIDKKILAIINNIKLDNNNNNNELFHENQHDSERDRMEPQTTPRPPKLPMAPTKSQPQSGTWDA